MNRVLKTFGPFAAAGLLLAAASVISYALVRDALLDEAARLPAAGIESALAKRCVSIVVLMSLGVWMGALLNSPVLLLGRQPRRRRPSGRTLSEALERLRADTELGRPREERPGPRLAVPRRRPGRVDSGSDWTDFLRHTQGPGS